MTASDSRAAARQLLHVIMLVMRSLSAEMRRTEQALAPAQLATLMRLAAARCTLSDLARHLAVSLPTVSKSVDLLVRRRLVERQVDPADRRQAVLRLTPAGRCTTRQVRQRAERHIAAALAPLPSRDHAALIAALAPLASVLQLAAPPANGAVAARKQHRAGVRNRSVVGPERAGRAGSGS